MANGTVQERLSALESEVARLKALLQEPRQANLAWLELVSGAFANDPALDEAERLGRKWRQSQRPRKSRARKR
jgi:hypothetical protein